MSHKPTPKFDDPYLQKYIEKASRRDHRSEHIFRRVLHVIERFIAAITILALLGALGMELYHMFTRGSEYFADVSYLLHNLLAIVVGLEFVRMLIDTTPCQHTGSADRGNYPPVVLSHDDPWSNLACIACIGGLFAIRRFLIPRNELKEETVEIE